METTIFWEGFTKSARKHISNSTKFICKFTNVQSDRDTCFKRKNKNVRATSQSAPCTSDYCWYLDYHEISLIFYNFEAYCYLSWSERFMNLFFTIKSRKESYKITPFTDNYFFFLWQSLFFFSIMQTGTLKLAETGLLLALKFVSCKNKEVHKILLSLLFSRECLFF